MTCTHPCYIKDIKSTQDESIIRIVVPKIATEQVQGLMPYIANTVFQLDWTNQGELPTKEKRGPGRPRETKQAEV